MACPVIGTEKVEQEAPWVPSKKQQLHPSDTGQEDYYGGGRRPTLTVPKGNGGGSSRTRGQGQGQWVGACRRGELVPSVQLPPGGSP